MLQAHHTRFLFAIILLVGFCFLSIHPPTQAISALHALLISQIQTDQSQDLKTIFSDSVLSKEPSSYNLISLLATGDVSLGRAVNMQTIQSKDFRWPFLQAKGTLVTPDITFINLEGPLPKNCPQLKDGMKLCGDQQHTQGLLYAGVDVANLANNHIGDFGSEGIRDTKSLLETHAIQMTGDEKVTYIQAKHLKFAFLGYNAIPPKPNGISWAIPERVTREIQEAKQQSDVVIVTFHWGIEYQEQPTEQQISLAHLAIDSGADAVIGNHPHWIQPMEIYKKKPIFYALGNFVFDQEWSQKTKEGMLAKLWFDGEKVKHIQLIPIFIERYGQPKIIENASEKQRLLQQMYEGSLTLEKRVKKQ